MNSKTLGKIRKLLSRSGALLSKREKSTIVAATALKMSLVALDLIGVGLLGMAASIATGTQIAGGALTANVIDVLNVWNLPNPYLLLIVVAVIFFVCKSLTSMALNAAFSRYLAQLESRKTTTLYFRLMHSGLEKLDSYRTAEVAHGLLGSAQMAFSTSINAVAILVSESLLIIAICLFLWAVNYLAFIGFAIFFGIVGITMYFLINRQSKLVARQVDSSSVQIQSLIGDSLQSFRQIHGLQRASVFSDEFRALRASLALGNAQLSNLSMLPRYITEIALMVGFAGLASAKLVIPEAIPNETIAIFVAAGFRIIGSMIPLQGAISLLNQVGEASLQVTRLSNSFDSDDFEISKYFEKPLESKPLVFRNVTYRHGNSRRAIVENLSFELARGQKLAIMGESGSGKSTIADLILGLRTPDSGEIICFGHLAPDYIRLFPGKLAYVPQQSRLVAGNLRDNVLLAFRAAASEDSSIKQVLSKLGLQDLVENLAEGLDTRVDSITSHLSGGQIQRVGIARAMINKPEILVLDESTSALDETTRTRVEESIRLLDQDIVTITIAHSNASLQGADKFLCLRNGRIQIFENWTSARAWLEDENQGYFGHREDGASK